MKVYGLKMNTFFEVLPTFSETPCATMLYFFLIVFLLQLPFMYIPFLSDKNKAKMKN